MSDVFLRGSGWKQTIAAEAVFVLLLVDVLVFVFLHSGFICRSVNI